MTREEALNELIAFKDKWWDGMDEGALDIAIKSLEAWGLVIGQLQRYRALYATNLPISMTIEDCLNIVLAGLAGVEDETDRR